MENAEEFVFNFAKEPVYLAFDLSNEIVLKQASLVLSTEENIVSSSTRLINSIPNPANNEAVISYFLDESGQPSIDLVDLSGRIIKHISIENQNTGLQKVRIETGDVESGIYLYRLSINGKTYVNKMVIRH